MTKELSAPVIFFESQVDWRAWLNEHFQETGGVWVKMAKKSSGIPSMSHPEALSEALCFGWIDGQRLGFDDTYFLQKFTPRRKQSMWSKVNIDKVESLTRASQMMPSGLAEVEAAKQDGRWERAYDSQRTMTVPEDFQRALDASPKARETFEKLTKANTYAFLWRIQTAKSPKTRQARIEKFVSMLERGEAFH